MSTVPPGPWQWRRVVPQGPEQFPPETEERGEALVAADGTWLLWGESGYGSPVVASVEVKDLIARAWELRRPHQGPTVLDADLNMEDEEGNSWTLLDLDEFHPAVVYPGAYLTAGRPGASAESQVIRAELIARHGTGDVAVLVTFRQTSLRSLEEALNPPRPGEEAGGVPGERV